MHSDVTESWESTKALAPFLLFQFVSPFLSSSSTPYPPPPLCTHVFSLSVCITFTTSTVLPNPFCSWAQRRWEVVFSVHRSIGLTHLWVRLQRQHHHCIWLYCTCRRREGERERRDPGVLACLSNALLRSASQPSVAGRRLKYSY